MSSRAHTTTLSCLTLFSLFLLADCGGPARSSVATAPVVLKGAGATAPYLAYSKWIEEFKKEEPGIDLQYEATGSGNGIQRLELGTVDFAASDIPLSDAEIAKMKIKVVHFPTMVGAIVPVYNMPASEVRFTGEVLAGIFSGRIKSWNHPELVKLNESVALPAHRIAVIHRSLASGSTYAFTDFLARTSDEWKQNFGKSASIAWPAGEEASTNEALAEFVRQTPYSIGYVELNYAEQQKLARGSVRNASGKFVKADVQSVGAAARLAGDLTSDTRISIVNSPGDGTYPICTLTWLIVPSHNTDPAKQKAIRRFLNWAYRDGQKIAMRMDYGILEPPLLDRVRDQIDLLR